MDKITKRQCMAILNDIQENEMPFWDWDEDYYNSGITDESERLEWANKRIEKIKEIIMLSEMISD